MTKTFRKIITTSFLLFLFAFTWNIAHAANPSFVISWKANTFVPKYYIGRPLPVPGSLVDVSFIMLSQNKGDVGKIIDVSKREVRWYINGNLVFRKKGLSNIAITNNMDVGDNIEVRIAVEYYDKSSGKYFPEIYFDIPTTNPKVIITKNLFNNSLLKQGLSLLAEPFFFNVKNKGELGVWWSVNRHKVNSKKQSFNLSINSEKNITLNNGIGVGVLVTNKNKTEERASYFKRFLLND